MRFSGVENLEGERRSVSAMRCDAMRCGGFNLFLLLCFFGWDSWFSIHFPCVLVCVAGAGN